MWNIHSSLFDNMYRSYLFFLTFFKLMYFFQLKCLAKIHDIYEETSERTIEDDIANVNVLVPGPSSHKINSYQSYDHPQDVELSSDGFYLTHQTGKFNISGIGNFLQNREPVFMMCILSTDAHG